MLIGRLTRRFLVPFDRAPDAGTGAAAASPAQPGAELDREALDRLRELDPSGANRLLERVFQAFETSAARLLPQLQDAHRLGDNAGVRHVVHTLKSSSASIGAIKLSQLCAEIETMIRLDTLDDLSTRLDLLDHELAGVRQALKQLPGAPS